MEAVFGPKPTQDEDGGRLSAVASDMMMVAKVPAANCERWRWLPYDLRTRKIDYNDADFNEPSLWYPCVDKRKYLHVIQQRLSKQQGSVALFKEMPSSWAPSFYAMSLGRGEEKELDGQLEKRRAKRVRPEELSD